MADGHDHGGRRVEEQTLPAFEAPRQQARDAVDRAERVHDRQAVAERERLLLEELEATANELAGLRIAMSTRATIEQAKGVLMSVLGCGPDDAFQHLVRLSQVSQRKLHDVATVVVAEAVKGRGHVLDFLDSASGGSGES